MIRNSERTRKSLAIVYGASLLIIMAVMFVWVFMNMYDDTIFYYRKGNYVLMILYALEYIVFAKMYESTKLGEANFLDLIISNFIASLFTNAIMYIIISLIAFQFIEIWGFLFLTLMQLLAAILITFLFNKYYYHVFPPRKTLLLYAKNDNKVSAKMNKYHNENFDIALELQVEKLDDELRNKILEFESVIVINEDEEFKTKVTKLCFENGIQLYLVPNIYEVIMNNGKVSHWIDTPILHLNQLGPQQFEKIIKRLMDIIVSFVALVIASPIMLIVALCIKLEDHGPVLYSQTRLTQYEREFKIYKFRSMKIDAEKNGIQFAKENDDRITKVGKVIRAMRLDELPQIYNILKGDMSLVGPRPERPEIANKIYNDLPEFRYRLKVKAGLTGYAQIYGKYNTSLKDKLLLDLLYIENYSLLLDIKLILMTVKIIFIKDSTEGVENNFEI